ncbi:DUF3995 domain-containing protein [Streptomyces sp. TRM70350]|uniref:DUF3995 domain-containing protein n=1 Tax=Streptomyces sp. TRM70350 TaxID=2856165 RepID=UPI001C46EDD1|nr:DUF3995 domain-containing protein [Streptomyces sp. TRM70350]
MAFAGLHFFWALGGQVGLDVSSGERLVSERPAWFVAGGLWGVGLLCLVGAAVALGLRRRGAHGRWWPNSNWQRAASARAQSFTDQVTVAWRRYDGRVGFRSLARRRQANQRLFTSRTAPAMGRPRRSSAAPAVGSPRDGTSAAKRPKVWPQCGRGAGRP